MCGYCSFKVGISQAYNHVAAALFQIEAAVRMGLTNLSCTSKPCEWLPKNVIVKATKMNDMKLARRDFGGDEKNGKAKLFT